MTEGKKLAINMIKASEHPARVLAADLTLRTPKQQKPKTRSSSMGMSVVLIGSPVSGYRVVGPFKTLDGARAYAAGFDDFEAWAVLLEAPVELADEE